MKQRHRSKKLHASKRIQRAGNAAASSGAVPGGEQRERRHGRARLAHAILNHFCKLI